MFIKRLLIKNYRCFGDEPVIIEFSNSGLTALIGPNNVGKSTILKALDILFGDKWPSSQFNENDFYNNKLSRKIILAAEFNSPIEISYYGENKEVIGLLIEAYHLKTGYGESSVGVDYFLLNTINDFNKCDWEIAKNKWENEIRISQDIKNNLPVVITIPLIKLQGEQPSNKWGVLGRMLQKVERIFSEEDEGKKVEEFEKKISDAVKVLRAPQEFKNIEKDIKTFWGQIKPLNLSGTDLEFLDYEPWRYYRQFKLSVKRHGNKVPLETLGEGVQRLAIIAIYRTYLKRHSRNNRAVLLVEEPESYLHPQARKTLFTVLKQAIKTEDTEGQIIYTTHSEDFIDCGSFEDIVVLWEENKNISVRHVDSTLLRKHTISLGQQKENISDQHIHYSLIETVANGLREALFAPRAVIVEGPSDAEVFHSFSNIDKNQFALVIADGKNNIPSIYTFLTAFGIPCLIVIDRDEANSENGINERIIKVLNQSSAQNKDSTAFDISMDDIRKVKNAEIVINNRLLVFGKNLETVLKKEIDDFGDLIENIRTEFNLPSNNPSKPREIQALGILFKDGDLKDVEFKLTEKQRAQLILIKDSLDKFIQQEIKERPQLLIPQIDENK